MRKKILLSSLTAVIIGFLLLLIATSAGSSYDSSVEQAGKTLKTYMNFYESAAEENLQQYAVEFGQRLGGARVTIMDENGVVLADSRNALLIDSDHSDRAEVKSAMKEGAGFATRKSVSVKESYSYYCKKIDGKLVRIALPMASEWYFFVKNLPMTIVLILVMSVCCLLFALLTPRMVLAPVEKIAHEASLGNHVETKSEEMQPLVEILNRMNDNLKEKIDEVNREKELVVKATGSKNEFISNITHEMNTPLTSIKGFAELLQGDTLSADQREKAVHTIISQSERLTNLIACVINYNQLDNNDLPSYEVNVSKIAEETAEILRPEMEKRGITLIKDIEKDVVVMSRHERINEIIGNLVRNAIKYNKENGKIEIIVKGGNKAYLIVRDTGIGVAEENKDKIFDRFFTVDKSHGGKNGGFGLGLAVVKKICKLSGWLLVCESKLGEGTSFLIEFSPNKQ